MAIWLKQAAAKAERQQQQQQVRSDVETVLAHIEARGDDAVRELSIKFDGFARDDFRLTPQEINACLQQLTKQEIRDIEFAQEQVHNFAQAQKNCLTDLAIETRPGVILGHRNIPISHVGCYVPGGNIRCWLRRICRSSPPKWQVAIAL